MSSLDTDVSALLRKQHEIVDSKRLLNSHSDLIRERIDRTEKQLRSTSERCNKEHER